MCLYNFPSISQSSFPRRLSTLLASHNRAVDVARCYAVEPAQLTDLPTGKLPEVGQLTLLGLGIVLRPGLVKSLVTLSPDDGSLRCRPPTHLPYFHDLVATLDLPFPS